MVAQVTQMTKVGLADGNQEAVEALGARQEAAVVRHRMGGKSTRRVRPRVWCSTRSGRTISL